MPDSPRLSTTAYELSGVGDDNDVNRVTDEMSTVPDVGAVAIEIAPGGGVTMFVKHKADVTLDRAAIDAAVRRAGKYAVVAERPR